MFTSDIHLLKVLTVTDHYITRPCAFLFLCFIWRVDTSKIAWSSFINTVCYNMTNFYDKSTLPWTCWFFFFSYSRRRNSQVSSGRCIIHSKCPIKRKSQCFQKKQLRYVFCTLQKGRKFQVLSGVASSWFIVAIRSSRPRNGEHLDKGKD